MRNGNYMTDITLFLKSGWKNIWKNKIVWIFTFMVLFEPLLRLLVPIQRSFDLPSALVNLAISIVSFSFGIVNINGVIFLLYHVSNNESVDFPTAYETSKRRFWRAFGATMVFYWIISPVLCGVLIYSGRPIQPERFAHNLILVTYPLSIFAGISYFVLTEIVVNDSRISKSFKLALSLFFSKIGTLALIGSLFAAIFYTGNVFISAGFVLAQNSLDLVSLHEFNFISPPLSFTDNKFYGLVVAIFTAIYTTFRISVFTAAYVKYSVVDE